MNKSYALRVVEEMKPMASRNGMFFVKTHWNHVSVNGVSITFEPNTEIWFVNNVRVADKVGCFNMARELINAVYKVCGWR